MSALGPLGTIVALNAGWDSRSFPIASIDCVSSDYSELSDEESLFEIAAVLFPCVTLCGGVFSRPVKVLDEYM